MKSAGYFDVALTVDKDKDTCMPLHSSGLGCNSAPTIVHYAWTPIKEPAITSPNFKFAVIGNNLPCGNAEQLKAVVPANGICAPMAGLTKPCQMKELVVSNRRDVIKLCEFTCECTGSPRGAYLIARNVPALPASDPSAWSICQVWPVSVSLNLHRNWQD